MTLYIRTEANRTTATGHMMRCLAIADAAADKGIASVFIVAEKCSEKFPEERGYETICLERQWDDFDGEIPFMQKLIAGRQIEMLLVDSYYVTKEYMRAVTSMTKTAYIDDLHAAVWPCSMLINYAVYHERFDYRKEYLGSRLLLGCDYVPLRGEFKNLPEKRITEQAKKILVVTGGTDEYHFMTRFLETLPEYGHLVSDTEFTLICGAYNQDLETIRELAGKYETVSVVESLSTLKEAIMRADLMITAGGVTLYEMAACGTPGICFSLADNQMDNVRGFEERGLVMYAGDIRKDFSYEKLMRMMETLLSDTEKRKAMSERLKALVDGKGAERIADALIGGDSVELSIIVPVYNMATDHKLEQCLDSLLAQTVTDYEIIAVDDASTDDSLTVLREYEKKYPDRIKVAVSEKNHRQGGAKNRGLKLAKGEWVGFIDSDDWITPDMYEKLLNKAKQTGADMTGCDYSLVDQYTMRTGRIVVNNTEEQTGVLDTEKHKKLLLRSGSMVVKIYRRQVLVENDLDFPEDIFYEDNCASPLWSLYFKHFERVEEPLYFYRTLPDSTTHHVTWERCLDRMKAGELFLAKCRERGFYGQYKDEIEFRFTELYYSITLFSYMYSGKKQKMSHTALLRKQMKKLVPDFQKNSYYRKMMPAEDQKLIAMHMRSNLLFFVYYKLLFGYRKLRTGGKK